MNESTSKIVLIPSFNTGPALARTVRDALAHWPCVWVVVDGSTDGSDLFLDTLTLAHPKLRLIRRPRNGGKGAAVQTGVEAALAEGITHILTLDADGQHPADRIPFYFEISDKHPEALVMGRPIFGPEAPAARVQGRKLTIFWTNLETAFCGLGDTLFGMRVYPAKPLLEALSQTPFARRYDFDPEIAVRLCWKGHRPLNLDTPVRYFRQDEGGVSHFHYLRDNIRLTFLHFRLVPEFLLLRWPASLRNKNKWKNLPSPPLLKTSHSDGQKKS